MNLWEKADAVTTRGDFVAFVRALREDLDENPQNWENVNLPDFLEAMEAWTESMDACYLNAGVPLPREPDWSIFAKILAAAQVYE